LAKLEIALIGAGLIARIHLDAWVKAGACVRIYATDDRATILAREFGATAVDSLTEALDGVTAVDICTPTGSHREIALAAIAAGAGVVCEKPLASNSSEAEEVVNAAEKAGLPLYPAHNLRFLPAFARLRQVVASGHLGRGVSGRFTTSSYHPRAWTEHAAERTGGILTDQMLHGADIAYWIFGEVTRVHAWYQGNIAGPAPLGTVATGTAVLTHARGAISQVVCDWAPPPTPGLATFHVTGTAGTVSYDSQSHLGLRVSSGTAVAVPPYLGESPFLTEIREFAEALAGGPEPRVGARDALATVRIIEAAAESAWTGRAIELSAVETGHVKGKIG
jgi:predicted dehydrogenase